MVWATLQELKSATFKIYPSKVTGEKVTKNTTSTLTLSWKNKMEFQDIEFIEPHHLMENILILVQLPAK